MVYFEKGGKHDRGRIHNIALPCTDIKKMIYFSS